MSEKLKMWTCPKCNRKFKVTNQSHMCTKKDIGEIFLDKPDHLVLAFDRIMTATASWEPNYVGAASHSVVFTNSQAWLIVKPMKDQLDIKFYYHDQLDSPVLFRITSHG